MTDETETELTNRNDGKDNFIEHDSQRSRKASSRQSSQGLTGESIATITTSPIPKTTPTEKAAPNFKRLLLRDLPFHQSSNILQIRNYKRSGGLSITLLGRDWFHRFLRLPTYLIVLTLLSVWTLVVLFFALVYMAVDRRDPDIDCGLTSDPHKSIEFAGAFAFSLETCTTVGYGLPDTNAFFDNCPELQVCIYFQMVFSMMFNAFLFSFFFAGLSRCNNRGAQVLFSEKAIIRRDERTGRYSFHVQVYDADCSRPLVESHVRFYAIRHRSAINGGSGSGGEESLLPPSSSSLMHYNLKFEPMRIVRPDDELGGMMFASVPQSASHHIDAYSPILPPSRRGAYEDGRIHNNTGFVLGSAGLNLREVDSLSGNRDGLQCVVCGESYGTVQRLVRHIRMCQLVEEHDNYPVKGSHRELDVSSIVNDLSRDGITTASQRMNGNASANGDAQKEQWYNEFRDYLATSQIEILCVFEAIEPLFSGTFQCMQSYTIDDISFGGEFAPCMLHGDEDINRGRWWRSLCSHQNRNIAARVDLDRFHEIVD